MAKKAKPQSMKSFIIIVTIIVIFAAFIIQHFGNSSSLSIACTEEAKICPDGSAVGRVLPNCDFAPCPSEINCSSFSVENCPTQCVICPPCEVCSSTVCQTEEFCKGIGFDRSWWESVRPKNCQCPEGYVQEGDACNPKCYYSTPKCLMPSILCSATLTCEDDSDCVPAQCCHPNSCINKIYKGVCNQLCTMNCQGPLDCGTGRCNCINNKCVVVPK